MKHLSKIIIFTVALAIQPAIAADEHQPKFGGQVRETASYDMELVAKDKELALHIADHKGKKVAAKEASATVVSGKNKETVKLTASGDGVLKGTGNFTVTADTKIIVSLTAAGKTEQARFAPMQKEKTDDHRGHKH